VGRQSVYFIAVLMILILAMVGLVEVVVARQVNSDPYPDLFAAYDAIMPGQTSAALSQYPCHFEKGQHDSEPTLCRIQPEDGIFSEVMVTFQSDDRIREVTFKPQVLRVGDLILRWGLPDIPTESREYVYLRWRARGIYAVVSPDTHTRRFSAWLPVYSIIVSKVDASLPI
jgi:hypothetical protein